MPRETNRLSIDFQPVVDQIVAQLRQVNGHVEERPVKRAFRIPEVAELLSLSAREVERLVADGEIHSIKVGRVRLIPPSAIDAFITRKLSERDQDRAD